MIPRQRRRETRGERREARGEGREMRGESFHPSASTGVHSSHAYISTSSRKDRTAYRFFVFICLYHFIFDHYYHFYRFVWLIVVNLIDFFPCMNGYLQSSIFVYLIWRFYEVNMACHGMRLKWIRESEREQRYIRDHLITHTSHRTHT